MMNLERFLNDDDNSTDMLLRSKSTSKATKVSILTGSVNAEDDEEAMKILEDSQDRPSISSVGLKQRYQELVTKYAKKSLD